ncbi:MAG: hypothetical protein WCF94_00300 [bacterium]
MYTPKFEKTGIIVCLTCLVIFTLCTVAVTRKFVTTHGNKHNCQTTIKVETPIKPATTVIPAPTVIFPTQPSQTIVPPQAYTMPLPIKRVAVSNLEVVKGYWDPIIGPCRWTAERPIYVTSTIGPFSLTQYGEVPKDQTVWISSQQGKTLVTFYEEER